MPVLESVGFALTIVQLCHGTLRDMKMRWTCSRRSRRLRKELESRFCKLAADLHAVKELFKATPEQIPRQSIEHCVDTIKQVCKCAQSSKAQLQEVHRSLDYSSSPWLIMAVRLAVNFIKAGDICERLERTSEHLLRAEDDIKHLHTMLGICNIAYAAKDEHHSDKFRYFFNVPDLAPHVVLDFTSQFVDGQYATMEGKFKQNILKGLRRKSMSLASDVLMRAPRHALSASYVQCALGMGGVGKTCALQGLANDQEIMKYFKDGIYFVFLGPRAKESDLIIKIAEIVLQSGGLTLSGNIGSRTSLRDACLYAASWFSGKRCLFLFDDLWRTEKCDIGYLDDLRQLLRETRHSRIAITTRDMTIASDAGTGNVVRFNARDPMGPLARSMLLTYIGSTEADMKRWDPRWKSSFEAVLCACAGLPLALGMAGRSVSILTNQFQGDLRRAWRTYSHRLKGNTIRLLQQGPGGHPGFAKGISTSLEMISFDSKSGRLMPNKRPQLSIREMFTALCVFEKKDWIPLSVLTKLWGVKSTQEADDIVQELARLSLVRCQFRLMRDSLNDESTPKTGELGIQIHDLVLVQCRAHAMEDGTLETYHVRLLDGYIPRNIDKGADSIGPELRGPLRKRNSGSAKSRSWWNLDSIKDVYIMGNLPRHLAQGGLSDELKALVLDCRWTNVRIRARNLAAFESDFDILSNAWKSVACERTNDSADATANILHQCEGFEIVRKAIKFAWERLVTNPEDLPTKMFSSLLQHYEAYPEVAIYLENIAQNSEVASMRRWRRCLEEPNIRTELEVRLSQEWG